MLILRQNVLWPQIGAASTPYARSVQPKTMQPAALPEPEALFDSLLTRREFKEHPNKISSTLFYLASIIIHGELLFRASGPLVPQLCGKLRMIRLIPDRSPRSIKVVDIFLSRSVSSIWKQPDRARLSEDLQRWKAEAGLFLHQASFRISSGRWCPSYHVQPFPQLCRHTVGGHQ